MAWILLIFFYSVILTVPQSTTLRYCSFWQFEDWSQIVEIGSSINFLFDVSNVTWLYNAHDKFDITSLYPLESTFFTVNATNSHLMLRNDYIKLIKFYSGSKNHKDC